jgi:hypothetical protein
VAVVLLATTLALAGCGSMSGPPPPSAPSIPPFATSELGSLGAIESAPARTPVPGFEDWSTINPQAVQVTRDGDALVLDLIGPVLWFNAERGVLFHTEVTGDFRATATVRTAKASDPDAAPGRDGTIQLAGLMARTEVPAENYVFIVAGSIGHSTGIETKTTTSSNSIYVQRGVGDGDADLELCREGPTFRLSFRAAGSTDPWQLVSTFERRDLPQTLQVGANIYTDAVPDLVARFDQLRIEELAGGESCERPS